MFYTFKDHTRAEPQAEGKWFHFNFLKFYSVISRWSLRVYTMDKCGQFVFYFLQHQEFSSELEGKWTQNCMHSQQLIRSLLFCLKLEAEKFRRNSTPHATNDISQLPVLDYWKSCDNFQRFTEVTMHCNRSEVIFMVCILIDHTCNPWPMFHGLYSHRP